MHNDVRLCFCGSCVHCQHCGSCSHERIQYGVVYFHEAGNGSNADMCSDVAGPVLFPPLLALLGAILDLGVTTILIYCSPS